MSVEPKKLLACDGGGIRGVVSLGILAEIERHVGKPLGQYFDYIGGTSTGAIIAAGLARGMSVADLQQFYIKFGPAMFEKRFLLQRYKSLYTSDPLKEQLKEVFGHNTTLGDITDPLLLVVTRNWTTDSPWPISSNPKARYNDRSRKDCNLNIPLWQLVRASTAAPVYFPPEVLNWDPTDPAKSFVFVDGGVTPYNNPAFLMYRMATLPEFALGWPTGEKNMMIVSVGTGSAPKIGAGVQNPDEWIPGQLPGLISALMYGAEVDQDINCRTVGRCMHGGPIDRELGTICSANPADEDTGKAFRYARYNPEFTAEGLTELGITDFDLDDLLRMDLATPANIQKLGEIGAACGKAVDKSHFTFFL